MTLGRVFDNPKYAGKGMHCFEVQTGTRYFLCARTAELCEQHRTKKTPPGAPTSQCAHRSSMFGFRANNAKGDSFNPFFATQKECDEVRGAVSKQDPAATLSGCALEQ